MCSEDERYGELGGFDCPGERALDLFSPAARFLLNDLNSASSRVPLEGRDLDTRAAILRAKLVSESVVGGELRSLPWHEIVRLSPLKTVISGAVPGRKLAADQCEAGIDSIGGGFPSS